VALLAVLGAAVAAGAIFLGVADREAPVAVPPPEGVLAPPPAPLPSPVEPQQRRKASHALAPPAKTALVAPAPDRAASSSAATIAGYVHDPFRRPILGARVRISRKGGKSIRDLAEVSTGEDGRFRAGLEEAGALVVEVRAPGFRVRVVDELTVTEGETLDLDVQLEPGARIAGRVVDDAGEPVGGAEVSAVPDDASGDHQATTDGEGRFEIAELGEATYCLFAHKPPYADGEACGVAPGAPVTLRLARPGAIAGRVIRSLGFDPVARFTVSARKVGGEGEMVARSEVRESKTGEFQIRDLPEGLYSVSVAGEGNQFAQRDGIEVRSGETTGGLIFELAGGARLAGTVVSSAGTPVAGAVVELILGGRLAARSSRARTDEAGRFEFDGVTEGRHRVNVEHPGYRPALLIRVEPRHLRGEALTISLRSR
jgi:hypothetical protein